MFIVVNLKRYRFFILIVITILLILFMFMFQESILRIFYPVKYEEVVLKYSNNYNISPYLVMAVIKSESNFRPHAQSHKGAKGLMQIIDSTAIWGAEKLNKKDFNIDMIFEPETNIEIGCWYLSMLMKQFDKDVILVLAAYNGGSGNVGKWLKDERYSMDGINLARIPFKETEEYVEKVLKSYNVYKKLYVIQ